MRRLVSLLLSFCCLTVANAEYTNYFVKGTEWTVVYTPCEPDEENAYSTYSLEGELTIAGHSCSQYYHNGKLLCYVYTEGDKVYGIRPGAEDESLLIYDFGLNVGDTIRVDVVKDRYYGEEDRHSKQVCVGEGLLTSSGHIYEYLEMVEIYDGYGDSYPATNFWIKGLGGIWDIYSDFANWGYDMIGGGADIDSITSNGNTVYHWKDRTVIAKSQNLVTPPADLETYDVDLYSDFVVTHCGCLSWSGQMGFDGQDVYIQGLCTDYPQAWIKGTLTDDGPDGQQQAVFESPQYIGYTALTGSNEQMSGPIYFTDAHLGPNVIMTWDAASRTLKCKDRFLENWGTEEALHLELYDGVTITPKSISHIVATASNASANATYGLYGTRVDASTPGLTIRNGKIEFRR